MQEICKCFVFSELLNTGVSNVNAFISLSAFSTIVETVKKGQDDGIKNFVVNMSFTIETSGGINEEFAKLKKTLDRALTRVSSEPHISDSLIHVYYVQVARPEVARYCCCCCRQYSKPHRSC